MDARTQELKDAMAFCRKHNLVTKEDMAKPLSPAELKEFAIRCKIKMDRYLELHPEAKEK